MFLAQNLTKSVRLTDAFNVLTIIQPGPFLGSLDCHLIHLQAVHAWLLVFIHAVVSFLELNRSYFHHGSSAFLL